MRTLTLDTAGAVAALVDFRRVHGDPGTWCAAEYDLWLEQSEAVRAEQSRAASVGLARGGGGGGGAPPPPPPPAAPRSRAAAAAAASTTKNYPNYRP
ncbi:hypothetical protein ACFWIR_11020, partial [Streptomyces olivaceus]